MDDGRPRPSRRSKAPQVHGKALRTFKGLPHRFPPLAKPCGCRVRDSQIGTGSPPDRFSLDLMLLLTIM